MCNSNSALVLFVSRKQMWNQQDVCISTILSKSFIQNLRVLHHVFGALYVHGATIFGIHVLKRGRYSYFGHISACHDIDFAYGERDWVWSTLIPILCLVVVGLGGNAKRHYIYV